MTYRREMEKAVKEYLKSQGFKHKTKYYSFYKNITDDIVQSIGFAEETGFRPHYFFMKTFVGVGSVALERILYEVTDGMEGNIDNPCGPPYFCSYTDYSGPDYNKHFIHCEFIGERPMEENVADLDRMFKEDVQMIFDKYKTQKSIYLCPITDKYFIAPCNWFYVPLAYYFNGEFDKAFEYIEERVKIEYENIARFGVNEQSERTLKTYHNYRENLKKWIAEKRQFKVDDEYLPVFK